MSNRKTFIVEIEYNELPENQKNNADVLYDTGVELAIENWMEGYKKTGSVQGDYKVEVKALSEENCKACNGSGLLGFQRESCWFCNGTGLINKEFNNMVRPKKEVER